MRSSLQRKRTMKLALALFATMVTSVSASLLGLTSVKQPLYLIGTDSDPVIRIADVPFVTRWSDPEWRFTAIC
jgi:hypothetical protein